MGLTTEDTESHRGPQRPKTKSIVLPRNLPRTLLKIPLWLSVPSVVNPPSTPPKNPPQNPSVALCVLCG